MNWKGEYTFRHTKQNYFCLPIIRKMTKLKKDFKINVIFFVEYHVNKFLR